MVGLKLHDIFSIPTTFPTQWTMNNEQWKLLTDIQVKCKLYKVYIYIYMVGIYGLRMRDILSIHPKECSSFPNRYTLRLQRTCHCYTLTPSDITFLLSVDKFEFKSKHFHLAMDTHTHSNARVCNNRKILTSLVVWLGHNQCVCVFGCLNRAVNVEKWCIHVLVLYRRHYSHQQYKIVAEICLFRFILVSSYCHFQHTDRDERIHSTHSTHHTHT